jgi:hypothetical protein
MAWICAGKTSEPDIFRSSMLSDFQRLSFWNVIRILLKLGSLFLGVTLAGLAIWAYQLGIDHNPAFGPKRIGLLLIGIGFLLWSIWDWIGPRWTATNTAVWRAFCSIPLIHTASALFHSIHEKIWRFSWLPKVVRSSKRICHSPLVTWMGKHWMGLSLGIVSVLAVAVYVWIFSAGRMIIPPTGTRYYSWLADAFQERQFHLLTQPSRGLLNLPNPYDYRLRSEVNYIWDVSLYDGKYFLYWGPVPGLVALLLQSLSSEMVRDSLLVLGFVSGGFLFAALLLFAIWRRFGNLFPGWGYLGGLLAVGLNVPMVWLLTRPAIYEASIAGGQFFLLAGLFWGFLAISRPNLNKGFLALAGVSWSLAAGTRVNLIPAILFLSFMVIWRIYQIKEWKLRSVIFPGLVFGLPLFIGAVFLAWYNYVRFDSIFEFGHRYQLTGPALPDGYDRVTSTAYVIPNLYNYFFRLPNYGGEFPFVTIPWEKSWPFFIRLPQDYYSAEPVAGILWLVPVTGLALLVLIRFTWLKIDQSLPERSSHMQDEDRSILSWLNIALAGSGCLQFVLLLGFISSSERYLADFALIAILFSTILIVQIEARFRIKKIQRNSLATLWMVSAGLTVIFAVVVSVSGYAHGFERINPGLYYQLLSLFQ